MQNSRHAFLIERNDMDKLAQETNMSKTLDARFHAEMLAVYDHCAALGFRPVSFRRMVILKGGVEAAKALIFQPGSTGLERLAALQKSQLSMEAMMMRPEYEKLFTALEIKEAAKRLAGNSHERSRGRLTAHATNHKPE